MNYLKTISKHFNFLKSYGFSKKTFSRVPDYEVIYDNKHVEIEILFGLSVPDSFVVDKNTIVGEILAMGTYKMWIAISINSQRFNLLESKLFPKEKIEKLKDDLLKCGDIIEDQIIKYSIFLKENIDILFK